MGGWIEAKIILNFQLISIAQGLLYILVTVQASQFRRIRSKR